MNDCFIIIAWFLVAGLTITVMVGTFHGLGNHDEDISSEHKLVLKKVEYVFSVLYVRTPPSRGHHSQLTKRARILR